MNFLAFRPAFLKAPAKIAVLTKKENFDFPFLLIFLEAQKYAFHPVLQTHEQ